MPDPTGREAHEAEHERLKALGLGTLESILQTTRHLLEQHSGVRVETETIHRLIHVHEAREH